MKILRIHKRPRLLAAFTILEAAIGLGLLGTVGLALLSGLSTGYWTMHLARENLRATQIMLEKMETIHLFRWDQLIQPNYVRTNFTAYYDPNDPEGHHGTLFTGNIRIEEVDPAVVPSSYIDEMRKVTITLTWTNGNLLRSRISTTYKSKYENF